VLLSTRTSWTKPGTWSFGLVLSVLSGLCACQRAASSCPEGTTLRREVSPTTQTQLVWCAMPNGEKHGPWSEWFLTGKAKGKPRVQGQYAQGRMQGAWTHYHDDGALKERGSYQNGVRTGHWTLYYEDGRVNRETQYDASTSRGDWVAYRPDGSLWAQGTSLAAVDHGAYQEWHPNGALAAQGSFERGRPGGEFQYWDETGQVLDHDPFIMPE